MEKTYLIAMAALLSGCLTAQTSSEEYIVSANGTLKDGSSVKGEFCSKQITGSTFFTEELRLDPAIVKSLAFTGTNGESKIELKNGDKFAMTVANESFKIKSLLGELAISRANFRNLSFSARKAAVGGYDERLVFYCTFDDEESVRSPAVGPSAKLEFGQIAANEGKRDGAFIVKAGVAGAAITLPTNTIGAEGCIEFWAKMTSGKSEFLDGGDPRFYTIFDGIGIERGCFEFASNNGGGNSGLGGRFCGMSTQTGRGTYHSVPYASIFHGADYREWHHYAFVWTQMGLSIFLDGKEVCHETGKVFAEELSNTTVTIAIPIRKGASPFNSKSSFMMDELKIWNFAKREFNVD